MNRTLKSAALALLLGATVSMGRAQSGPVINPTGQRLEGVFIVTVTPESGAPPSKVIRLFLPNGIRRGSTGIGARKLSLWGVDQNRRSRVCDHDCVPQLLVCRPEMSITTSRGVVKLNETADQLSGRFVSDTTDLDGNLLSSIAIGVQGQRIQIQPLP